MWDITAHKDLELVGLFEDCVVSKNMFEII